MRIARILIFVKRPKIRNSRKFKHAKITGSIVVDKLRVYHRHLHSYLFCKRYVNRHQPMCFIVTLCHFFLSGHDSIVPRGFMVILLGIIRYMIILYWIYDYIILDI